jgi:hypothetical protein
MATGWLNWNRLLRCASALLFAVVVSCGGATSDTEQDSSDLSVIEYGAHAHQMPWRTEAQRSQMRRSNAASGAHLNYYGGHVVSNAKVVQVLYGTGTYLGNIKGTTSPTIASFYSAVLNSAYVDWLTEYNTPASGGTNQHIGRGTFSKQVQITPASARNHATISDTQIQQEISSQVSKGKLPTPDANTIYMVSFPKGKTITQGGSASCVVFCAYHGTFKRNGQNVYYGVLPDMSPGSGCDLGCGGNTWFNNQTSVASHELIETITDAEVGLATVVGPPLAWYDPNNGEIGDICNAQQGSIAGFTVQTEWSNQAGACIVHK